MSLSQFLAVDILSDDDNDAPSISTLHPAAKRNSPENYSGGVGGSGGSAQQIVIIDDEPTPVKPNLFSTPLFVAETPLSFGSHATIVKCSIGQTDLREKLTGISSLICLESDNESESSFSRGSLKESGHLVETLGQAGCQSSSPRLGSAQLDLGSLNEDDGLYSRMKDATAWNNGNDLEITSTTTKPASSDRYTDISGNILLHNDYLAEDLLAQGRHDDNVGSHLKLSQSPVKKKRKRIALDGDNNTWKFEEADRKKQLKEEKALLVEERKQKKQEEKLQKEALKAEAAELKKLDKEKQKWEKGKLALKSIIAEIDAKVLEDGSIGGHLLTRFAERGLSYRITSNPVERSILWKMTVPEQIAQLSNISSEVPYILLLYQAEEFCDLVISESLIAHVQRVRSQYPLFTICYLTNKLMNFIIKCEQSHYKNSNISSWKRPPVEEALSRLSIHFSKVHSRQCIDEAEIADHIVGLTSSLASCQFRTKLTWLSVNANGSNVSKDFTDKKLIKKNVWLKVLVAIPKVQPRHAIAIWKKYPTMRSLLNIYMDPNKSVHEKEFLLKDLLVEGLLGREDRRLGEVCSKRIFRILMAQRGGIRTDDVEDGADFFSAD